MIVNLRCSLCPYRRGRYRLARLVERFGADAFAANILPVIASIRAAGAWSLRGIASKLEARKVSTARGGAWNAAQVGRILQRAA